MEVFVHLQELFLGASYSRQDDHSSFLPLKFLYAANFDTRTSRIKASLLDHQLDHLLNFLNLSGKGKQPPLKTSPSCENIATKAAQEVDMKINDEQWAQAGNFSFPVIVRLLYYYLLLEKCLSVKLSYLYVSFPIAYDQNSYRQLLNNETFTSSRR